MASPNPVLDFFSCAERDPHAPAIVSATLTMDAASVADAVRRSAARLRRLGVRPGQVVAINARPEWEAILTLALMHEGATSLHASAPVLEQYRNAIDVLLGDPPPGAGRPATTIPVDGGFVSSLGAVNPAVEPPAFPEGLPARVVFSSGTTGAPKGVPFTVELLRARIASARRHWMPADPFFSLLGIDTVSGFQTFAWSAFNGVPWVVPGTAEDNHSLITRLEVRAIKTSPARLAELLGVIERRGPLPTIETVQVAGAALTSVLVKRCSAALGVAPTYLYGSTEGGTVTRGMAEAARPDCVGAVVAEAELRIVGRDGALCDDGDVGVVEYRTPVTASGYWASSVEESDAFRDGWFRPGDRGRLTADGQLELHGRVVDVVNAGGAKVDLAAIDRALGELDEVRDAAACAFVDSDGLLALGVAFVAASNRLAPARAEIERTLRVRFPNVRVRALAQVASLPRTPTGKLHRDSLSHELEQQWRAATH